ncbi:MAG TPA: class I SAM-dependent methyltransferase [Alphaproteobacteria bacterium]|nr:class I SAM-dependent methyltransferase [Alphaproteobacteria bacterium]
MTCPICGDHAAWPIPFNRELGAASTHGPNDAGYGWRLCRRCGNGYPTWQPDLKSLSAFWAASRSDINVDSDEEKARWAYRRQISRTVAERSYRLFAPAARAPGRFLDIACGHGETVREFAAHGWDAEGIDADPTMRALHAEIGIRSRIGQFESVDIDGRYDMIQIAHAIYFMTDPMAFLRRVKERLAPDGHFCVVLANYMAAVDPGLPSYAHSFFPTGASMEYALALAGFATMFRRRVGGSIFIAAKPAAQVPAPRVHPTLIYAAHRTKGLRYALLGRPYLAARGLAKRALGRP